MAQPQTQPQFRVIEDSEQPENHQAHDAAAAMLALALKTLSQKTVVALASLFTLGAVASAFALWWRVLPDPTTYQLIGLGVYAIFILAVLWLRRK